MLVNIFDPNNKVTVTKDGFTITMNDGLPLVYTPTEGGHEELWEPLEIKYRKPYYKS